MRCLADFTLDSDLCLPAGAAPLTLNDPAGRFSLTLYNATEAEHAVPEAVLSAQMIFETDLRFPDEWREIDELADKLLGEALNVLAFATNRKFVPRTLKRLVDWTPGFIDRDAMIYTETPEWDLAEPELNADYIQTAERILAMQAGPEHQAAMRWHRIAVREGVLEQQFSYFWFALEIVAEALKGTERVPNLSRDAAHRFTVSNARTTRLIVGIPAKPFRIWCGACTPSRPMRSSSSYSASVIHSCTADGSPTFPISPIPTSRQ